MGINLRHETEDGRVLADIPDPKGYLTWVLDLVDTSHSMCLRFIDPYGDTVFNTLQIPVLISELSTAEEAALQSRLDRVAASRLERYASSLDPKLFEQIRSEWSVPSVHDLKLHIRTLIGVAREAMTSPHMYVRFVGD